MSSRCGRALLSAMQQVYKYWTKRRCNPALLVVLLVAKGEMIGARWQAATSAWLPVRPVRCGCGDGKGVPE